MFHCFPVGIAACALPSCRSWPSGWSPLLAAEPAKPQPPAAEQVAPPKDIAELRGIEERVKKVVAKVMPATVGIRMGNNEGSGVIVSKDGLVMTAGHVVGKPGQTVTFCFADGKTAKGTTLGLYAPADAGLMKITDKGEWPFVERGRSTDVKLGSWCVDAGPSSGHQTGPPARGPHRPRAPHGGYGATERLPDGVR